MRANVVAFDDIRGRISNVLKGREKSITAVIDRLYLVRDLFGRVRVSVSDVAEANESFRDTLKGLADDLHRELGAHGCLPGEAISFLDEDMLKVLDEAARPFVLDEQTGRTVSWVYWVERLVTGGDWWSIDPYTAPHERRFTLYSVKGGVGRTTTTAVLAWHLARNGHRVLVFDLDLESPGLSSAILSNTKRPQFGVVDWFVEDLVGQGDYVLESMAAAPGWAHDFDGDVRVVPAHGTEPGEYLAKLGRVYVDTVSSWTARLCHLVSRLEEMYNPSIVLLESRNGLHDIAAATVTDMHAQVLLFAIDSESHWADYSILFQHWQKQNVASEVRERLSIVSALTPELETERYLQRFRENAWNLYRDYLYDAVPSEDDGSDPFSFDVSDDDAPHDPLVVHWTRGLSSGVSLQDLQSSATTVRQAYSSFLRRFDTLGTFNRPGEIW